VSAREQHASRDLVYDAVVHFVVGVVEDQRAVRLVDETGQVLVDVHERRVNRPEGRGACDCCEVVARAGPVTRAARSGCAPL
jgi:hypothetical protein